MQNSESSELFNWMFANQGTKLQCLRNRPRWALTPFCHKTLWVFAKTMVRSKTFKGVRTSFKQCLQKYCESAYSKSGINQRWILKNSKELLEHLKSQTCNNVTSINSFDFSILYTTLPHQKLKDRLTVLLKTPSFSRTVTIDTNIWY